MPTVALSTEILVGTIETKKLLRQTQEQAATVAAAEERSRLILGSVDEGICGLNTEGLLEFVNPAGARMLGYEQDELIGQPMHSRIHYEYADGRPLPLEECSMYQTAKDGKARAVTDEILWRKDGTSFPVEYTATPIRRGGEVVGSVVAFRDITNGSRLRSGFNSRNTPWTTPPTQSSGSIPSMARSSTPTKPHPERLEFSREELLAMNIVDINPNATPERLAELMAELRENALSDLGEQASTTRDRPRLRCRDHDFSGRIS